MIELVAGFAISPLRAALGVTVLPVAALAAAAIPGEPRAEALAGAVLLAGGAAALAFLPAAGIAWTLVPQLLAGRGMGLALPALGARARLPEAARDLVARHVGIVVVLAILAPVATHKLKAATDRAILQGAALVLDAPDRPAEEARARARAVQGRRRRAPARRPAGRGRRQRGNFADNAAVYDRLAARLDDVVVVAVQDAFKTAYLIAAALALLGRRAAVQRLAPARDLAGDPLAAGSRRASTPSSTADRPRHRSLSPIPASQRAAAELRRLRRRDPERRRSSCSTARRARRGIEPRGVRARALRPQARGDVRARARRQPAQRGRPALTCSGG